LARAPVKTRLLNPTVLRIGIGITFWCIDLNTLSHSGEQSFDKVVIDKLNAGLGEKIQRRDIYYKVLFDKFKSKYAVFVFDNYDHQRDKDYV
jgi:hypothetical protein